MQRVLVVSAALLGPMVSHALAWEFRVRFVERTGIEQFPFTDTFNAADRAPHRLRVQFGAFDDAESAAPDGGLLGWNLGRIDVTGPADNSDETRTPGRLSPFNFAGQATANGDPPLPQGDPFSALTEIDATLGTQSPLWRCDSQGNPEPMPLPVIRGRNTYVSVYEITIDPRTASNSYSITFSGSLLAATEWRVVGTPTPPDCSGEPDPTDPLPGTVTYAPLATPPDAFSRTIQIVVPSPATLAPMLLGFCPVVRRRRR